VTEIFRAKVNDEGRLVIPAPCRKQLGLQPGQEVLLQVTRDGILLTTFDQALKHFQDEVTKLVGPGVSLPDDLIADRRAEATREAGE
jgi:AbrB family looped-hinge helix DNA binding protein